MLRNGRKTEMKQTRDGKGQTNEYLSDKDAGDALGIVAFRVGWSKQLLAFPFLKAVQEGRVQDMLQHLINIKRRSHL